jgi:tetratricopeptide (TPR) repeat protein
MQHITQAIITPNTPFSQQGIPIKHFIDDLKYAITSSNNNLITMEMFINTYIKPRTATNQETEIYRLNREQPFFAREKAVIYISYPRTTTCYCVVETLQSLASHTPNISIWIDAYCINYHHPILLEEFNIYIKNLSRILTCIGSTCIILGHWPKVEFLTCVVCMLEMVISNIHEISTRIIMSEQDMLGLQWSLDGGDNWLTITNLFHSINFLHSLEETRRTTTAISNSVNLWPNLMAEMEVVQDLSVVRVDNTIRENVLKLFLGVLEIMPQIDMELEEEEGLVVRRISRYMAYFTCYFVNDLFEEALVWGERIITCMNTLGGNYITKTDTAMIYNRVTTCLMELNRFEEAIAMNDKVMAVWSTISPDLQISCLENRSQCMFNLKHYITAIGVQQFYISLLEMQVLVKKTEMIRLVFAYELMAHMLMHVERHVEALTIYEETYTKVVEWFGPDHHELAMICSLHARCLLHLQRCEDALIVAERALAINHMQQNGFNYADAAFSLQIQADIYYSLGRLNEAATTYEKALKIRTNLLDGVDDDEIHQILIRFSSTLIQIGKFNDALMICARLVKLSEQRNHPELVIYILRHALCLFKVFGSLLSFDSVTQQLRNITDHSQLLDLYSKIKQQALTLIGVELNEFELALIVYDIVVMMEKELLEMTDDDPQCSLTAINLAQCLIKLGRIPEALKYLSKAVVVFENVYGKQHYLYAVALGRHGFGLKKLGGEIGVEMGKTQIKEALEILDSDSIKTPSDELKLAKWRNEWERDE